MLTDNLCQVKETINNACKKAGRSPEEVLLVAVSKTKPEQDIMELYQAGQRDFGENYIQELRKKHEDLPSDIRWHMIGHLQRNKVKYIAPYIYMIHSVDTIELAETIEKEAEKAGRVIPVLIEVNAAHEESKFGVTLKDAPAFAQRVASFPHIELKGFMTSAPLVKDAEDDRVYFREMKKLSVDMNVKNINNGKVDALSMGMTNDYPIAVEEGSTIVRVGTAIFGRREYNR